MRTIAQISDALREMDTDLGIDAKLSTGHAAILINWLLNIAVDWRIDQGADSVEVACEDLEGDFAIFLLNSTEKAQAIRDDFAARAEAEIRRLGLAG